MWLIALLWTAALADEAAYQACCDAVDAAACPPLVEVAGPGTLAADDAGTQLSGVWLLTCAEGAAMLPRARRAITPATRPSEVLTPLTDGAAACFAAACDLPEGLCIERDGAARLVVDCARNTPATREVWSSARLVPGTAVISGSRVVRATEARADRERETAVQQVSAAPAPSPPTTSAPPRAPSVSSGPPAAPGASSAPATARISESPPAASAAIERPPTAKRPAAAPARREAPSLSPDDLALPDEPPEPCVVQAGLRQASIDQVELGDESRVGDDVRAALGHYRAAITINKCNPFAWAQLGTAMLDGGAADPAVKALEIATRLMPDHFRAWAELGRARESVGANVEAIAAYQEALTLRPGYVPAEAGLKRSIRNR